MQEKQHTQTRKHTHTRDRTTHQLALVRFQGHFPLGGTFSHQDQL